MEQPSPAPKNNKSFAGMLIKLMVAALMVGVGYHFFHSHSSGFSILSSPLIHATKSQQRENCDLFTGQWIPYPGGPAYTNATCKFIHSTQDCMRNGKPDLGFLYWRWKPYGCDLPTFDAEKFLSSNRDKSWGFIGDSLLLNQIQSLLCLLTQVEEPVLVYQSKDWKTATWRFTTYNLTLANIWAPLLAKAKIVNNHVGDDHVDLHIDILEANWTSQYQNFDYVLFSGGQWFYKRMLIWENNKVIGCHYCRGERNLKDFDPDYLYRRVLQLTLEFMGASKHKPIVLFRTWTASHFEYGEWYSGGVCNRTVPYKEGEFYGKEEDHVMRGVEVEEFEKAAAMGSGIDIKLMDTFHLSLLRADGHPGPYMHYHPFENNKGKPVQNDCLHWCLPGPVDTWNQILLEMVKNEESLMSAI